MNWNLAKRTFSYFLAWLMIYPSGSPSAFAKGNSDVRRAEEVKAAVRQLGTGKDARVLLALRDGEKVGGYINQTQDDGFSVRLFCTGNDIPFSFVQVRGLRGLNVATGIMVSAGKGVSEKAAAGLAAHNPCRATAIQAKNGNHELRNGIIAGAVVCGLLILLGVAMRVQGD